MKKFLLVITLLIIFLIPVYAKEDKFTIVSGDINTVGSEICFDTECFYVIENDGSKVKMLAKYNLYIGNSVTVGSNYTNVATAIKNPTGIQNSNALGLTENYPYIGTIEFSNNKYSGDNAVNYSGSLVEFYVNKYNDYMENICKISIKSRIIGRDDLLKLGCESTEYSINCPSNVPNWVGSTSYWTSIINNVEEQYMVAMSSGNIVNCDTSEKTQYGIRPVIEVPTGYFDKDGTIYNGTVDKIKTSDGVISNDNKSINVTFNDLNQHAKYETIIYNDTDKVMYVNYLETENISEKFIDIKLDPKSENMMIEPNGSTKVTFYINTLAIEGAGKNLDDDVKINFMVSDEIYNPNTFTNVFETLILFIVLATSIYYIKKNKKISVMLLLISFSLIGINYVNAKDFIKVTIEGKIKYESQNFIETTGTVLNGKTADYSNSKEVWAYYDKVKNVEVKSLMNEPTDYYKKFDLTESNNGRVMAYLIENNDKETPYDLVIMSQGVIIANSDSSFLFSFPKTEKVEGLKNIDFSETTTMQGMFIGNENLKKIDTEALEMDNTKDTSYMFYKCNEIEHDLDDFNLENVETKDYMIAQLIYNEIENHNSDSNLDFSIENDKASKYYIDETKNDKYPIYYFRGNVIKNNVVFAGFCWKIVRTTNTGGIKLIYNGMLRSDNSCNNTGVESQIGKSGFNGFWTSASSVGYMSGTGKGFGNIYPRNQKYVYGNDIVYENGLYILKDTYITDNWANDYKEIAKKYHYSCFNDTGTCESVKYIIFYGSDVAYYNSFTGGETLETVKEEMFKNDKDSTIKTYIDSWFENNVIDYINYLEDTVWCNDREIYSGSLKNKDEDCSGDDSTFFAPYARNILEKKPNITCSNIRDSFTVSENYGNGKLKYPIGMLTADEVTLAGIGSESYLNTGESWRTMSPYWYNSYAKSILMFSNGKLGSYFVLDSFGVRPSISLKHNIKYVNGDGTVNNPYVIE